MRKNITLLVFIAGLLVVGLIAYANSSAYHEFEFVGMWQAIDSQDGSVSTLSILPLGNGNYKIQTGDSHFSACGSEDGRGHMIGIGYVVNGILVSEDRVLNCSNGVVLEFPSDFIPNSLHDLLELDLRGNWEPFVFHRISSKP